MYAHHKAHAYVHCMNMHEHYGVQHLSRCISGKSQLLITKQCVAVICMICYATLPALLKICLNLLSITLNRNIAMVSPLQLWA